MLEIKNLSGDLGEFHLRDINLMINNGEYIAVLGPTGAGKTVLIEYIVGIYKPDKGSILVDGEDITPLFTEERNIGYVPQDYALFPNLSVEKNIAYGLEARRMPTEQVNRLISEMISSLQIDYIRHRMPLHLSGGEKQRVALGRALATEPKLLLLDEPLSALDENMRTEMARELKRIQRDVNGTFIHVCHNFEEAFDVADRIVIMNDGKIIQTGDLREILTDPKNEFIARFVKSQNIAHATTDGSVLRIGDENLVKKNPFKGDVTVVIRPENIQILEDGDDSRENVFYGEVKSTLSKIYFTEIVVDSGISLIIHTTSERKYKKGDRIKIQCPAEHVVVLERS